MAERLSWRQGLGLLGLVSLALALRCYRLGAESLWYDEAYSVWSSRMDIRSPRTLWEWRIEFPLYYWQNDQEPGDTTGHGVNDVWFVVPPAGIDPENPGSSPASNSVSPPGAY